MNSLETIVLSVLQGKDWHWKPARLEVLVSIKASFLVDTGYAIRFQLPEDKWRKIIWKYCISYTACLMMHWLQKIDYSNGGTMVIQHVLIIVVWKAGIICILNVRSQKDYGRRLWDAVWLAGSKLDGRNLLNDFWRSWKGKPKICSLQACLRSYSVPCSVSKECKDSGGQVKSQLILG